MLGVIDEFSRECLAIRIYRKLYSTAVIDALSDLFILRGVPRHVRSDNGPEFIAKAVRGWINAIGTKPHPSDWAVRGMRRVRKQGRPACTCFSKAKWTIFTRWAMRSAASCS